MQRSPWPLAVAGLDTGRIQLARPPGAWFSGAEGRSLGIRALGQPVGTGQESAVWG